MKPLHYFNTVLYDCNGPGFDQIISLWRRLASNERRTERPQMPDFIAGQYEYLTNISVAHDNISFTSKFSPNEEVLLQIVEQYPADYLHIYNNNEKLIYGIHLFIDNLLHEFQMEEEDYLLYHSLPDGQFSFEGKAFDNRIDIFHLIVSQKIYQVLGTKSKLIASLCLL